MSSRFIQYLITKGLLNAETVHQEKRQWEEIKKTQAPLLTPIDSSEKEGEEGDAPSSLLFETGWLSKPVPNDTLHQFLYAFENQFQQQPIDDDSTQFTLPPNASDISSSEVSDITKFTPPPLQIQPISNDIPTDRATNTSKESPKEELLLGGSSENRYEHLEMLGEGGMGIVQSVRDRILQRNVALKTIRSKKEQRGSFSENELWMNWRLKTEAYVTAYLEHPNIVPLYDLQQKEDGELFFTMRRIGGKTLDALIQEKKSLIERKEKLQNEEEKKYIDIILKKYDEKKFLSIFFKVCDAVSYAHSKGIVHRDLKPENIMVGEFGEVYVMDWGIAKKQKKEKKKEIEEDDLEADFPKRDTSKQILSKMLWEESVSKTVEENVFSSEQWRTIGGMGTLGYMPPEQQEDAAHATPQSDIYALGKILRQIYTLHSPLEEYKNFVEFAKTQAEETGSLQSKYPKVPTPFSAEVDLEKDIPRDVFAIIEKATQEQASSRYESAKEFSEDLERYVNDVHVSVREYSFQEMFARWIRHHRMQIIFGTTLFLVGCFSIGYFNIQLGRRFDLKGEQVLKKAQEELAKANRPEMNAQRAIRLKLEILLNASNALDSALLLSSKKEPILQEKAKIGEQLIQLCCETEDYLLANYFAKELRKQNSISPEQFKHYQIEIEQAKNQQLQHHQERLSHWERQFQEREITLWEQDTALLEISKMQEDQIFQQLLLWLTESVLYFKENRSKNPRKVQWYKTVVIALGRLEKPQAGEPVLNALQQLVDSKQTRIAWKDNLEEQKFLIELAKSLGNAKPLNLSLAFQKIRESLGKHNLFWYETQYVFDALAQIDLNYQQTRPEEESFFERGELFYYLKKYNDAKRCLTQAITKYPRRSELLFYLAQIAVYQKNYTEASALLTQTIQLRSGYVPYYLARSQVAFLAEQWDSSLQDIQKALQLKTEYAESHLLHGKLWMQRQEWQKALSAYQKAIELRPEDGEAYYLQGKVYEQLKEWEFAQKSYTEALLRFPYDQMSYLARGQLYYERKQIEAALRDLTQAISLHFSEQGYLTRAQLFLDTQQYEQARADYEKLLEVVPENKEGRLQYAYTCFKQKEHSKALQEIERVLQKYPQTVQAYYYQSLIYLDLKKWDRTLESVQKGLQIAPEASNLYLTQGRVYQEMNEIKKSIASYTQAIRFQPQQEDAYFLRGQVYVQEKNWPQALQDFSEVLRINPQHVATYYKQAQVYLQQKKRTEAFQSLHEAIRLDPQFTSAIVLRIQLKQESLDFTGAIQDLELLLNQAPQDAELYYQRALLYKRQDKQDEAVLDLNEAIRLSPQLAKAYFQRGLIHVQLGKSNTGIKDFDEAIRLEPEFAEAYYQRGRIWQQQQELNKALADYQKAIELSPERAEFYLARGDLYFQTHPQISLTDYTHAIELNPQFKEAYFRRATLYFQQQHFEEALKDYDTILKYSENEAMAHYSQGQIYALLHQEKEALDSYQKAIRFQDKDFRFFYSRGLFYLALKKETEAIQDFTQGIPLNPRYAPFYAELGKAYQQQKNEENAYKNFQIALQINPRYAPTYLYVGEYYEKQKNYELAQKSYLQAIALEPNFALAYLALGWLQYQHFSKKEALENFERAILYFRNLNMLPAQTIPLYLPMLQKIFTQHRDLFDKCKQALEIQISETAPPSSLLGFFLWQEAKFYVDQKQAKKAEETIQLFFKYFPKMHPYREEMNALLQRIFPKKNR